MHSYDTQGVCASKIDFDIVDNKITNVRFLGGCNGNLQGLSVLIEGMDVNEAIKKLKGIRCKDRPTSCPDQLSRALEEAINSSQ